MVVVVVSGCERVVDGMLCRNPFLRDKTGRIFVKARLSGLPTKVQHELMVSGIPFPCGQCLPCRINRRRIWTTRLILERHDHDHACFVTLTYNSDYLPSNATLVKEHVQLFLKRLRKSLEPHKIRYFCAGEYGSQSLRPHYHLILFGVSSFVSQLVAKCWPFGLIHVGEFSHDSASYVAGYVTKKHVNKGDINGRIPEFTLQSRRPGIGFSSVRHFCDIFRGPHFRDQIKDGKIPPFINIGKTSFPLGRYLSGKIQLTMEMEHEISDVCAQYTTEYLTFRNETHQRDEGFIDYLLKQKEQRVSQITWKYKNFRKNNRDKV